MTPTFDRPLLMIPGPIEVSDRVLAAASAPPRSHVDPSFIEDFGEALRGMRALWGAEAASQPFVISGGGTMAMEAAACNLIEPGERVAVLITGTFGARMAEILRRRGAAVRRLEVPLGEAVDLDRVDRALEGAKALFATHVDTSTGRRVDPEALADLARAQGALSVFDGVCATAAERFEMSAWGADLYLTASQKAIGLPPGLALWVCSQRALRARAALRTPPPLSLDFNAWRPIMQAYERGEPSYLSTPATTLIPALRASLEELQAEGVAEVVARHARAAEAMRAGFSALGLSPFAGDVELANTLSALRYPEGVGPELPGRIRARGVIVAGGLLAEHKERYFRVGHMGVVTGRPHALLRTVRAIGLGLRDCAVEGDSGAKADVEAGVAAAAEVLGV